jgi:DNA-directed RNA polymerase subunit RPC12/RpoP
MKAIYKCTKCPVEFIDTYRIDDKNDRCPKCGAFMKVRFWDDKSKK